MPSWELPAAALQIGHAKKAIEIWANDRDEKDNVSLATMQTTQCCSMSWKTLKKESGKVNLILDDTAWEQY